MSQPLTFNRKDAAAYLGVEVKEFDKIIRAYPEKIKSIQLRENQGSPRFARKQLDEFVEWCIKYQVYHAS